MGRILAIDYGNKRVGLATTDPLKIIATPLATVHITEVMSFLHEYCQKEEVEALVLGWPTRLDGTDTNVTQAVRRFEQQLKKHFPQKAVYLHDERFTSKMALDAMIAGGTKKKDRRNKGNIDKISASIILQSFLESQNIL